MEELISVIVPIYNVEKYLNRCIESIVNQTYKDLEIILIDDGSTDESSNICDKWKEKDNRIKVIHKFNEGVSIARNIGIDESIAKWITFIDSDDYIEKDCIELLYKAIIDEEAEISIGGFSKKAFVDEVVFLPRESSITNSGEMIKRLYTGKECNYVWGKLYKKELFKDIRFPENKLGEDFAIMYKLFNKASRITHINKVIYYYTLRGDSLTKKELLKVKIDIIDYIEDTEKLMKNKYPQIYEEFEQNILRKFANYTITFYRENSKKEYKYLKNKLRKCIKRNKENLNIQLALKVKCILIAYFGFARFFKY